MRRSPESFICALGHVARTDELLKRGMTARQIESSVRTGTIRRAMRGVFVCRHTDADQHLAVAARARISCCSVLRRAGVWVGLDRRLHLQLSPQAKGPRPILNHDGYKIRYHWADSRFGNPPRSWRVSRMESVWQAIHCLDEENAIACLESAVHQKFLTVAEVRRLCAFAPRRLQAGISEMEFTSDSGQETITRRRLRHIGYSVVAQVRVSGIPYSQDLVVEDCVTLETDGKKWHGPDRFDNDRNRDSHVEGFGRRTLRLTQNHILHEWPTTLATIDRMVTDAKRERMRRTGRIIIGRDDPYEGLSDDIVAKLI